MNYNVFRLNYIFACFSSLLDDLRAKLKSTVIARKSDVEIARRFTEFQKHLAKCAGNDYCNEDRAGLFQLMALLYGETQGLNVRNTSLTHPLSPIVACVAVLSFILDLISVCN